jgi:hypothetical protein
MFPLTPLMNKVGYICSSILRCSATQQFTHAFLPCSSISNFVFSFIWSSSTHISSRTDLFLSSSSHIRLPSSLHPFVQLLIYLWPWVQFTGTTIIRPKTYACALFAVLILRKNKTCNSFYQWVLLRLCTPLAFLLFLTLLHSTTSLSVNP